MHRCKVPRSKVPIKQLCQKDCQVRRCKALRSKDSGEAVAEIYQWQAVVT